MSSSVRNAMQFKYKIAMIGHLPQAQFHGWKFMKCLRYFISYFGQNIFRQVTKCRYIWYILSNTRKLANTHNLLSDASYCQ